MSHDDDTCGRFLLPEAGVRGVYVRLHASWQELLSHADYPSGATALLGPIALQSRILELEATARQLAAGPAPRCTWTPVLLPDAMQPLSVLVLAVMNKI